MQYYDTTTNNNSAKLQFSLKKILFYVSDSPPSWSAQRAVRLLVVSKISPSSGGMCLRPFLFVFSKSVLAFVVLCILTRN